MPPRLARLLAAVVAVALVAGAFALRGALADDDASGPGAGPGSGDGGDPPDGGPYRVLCDEDLGDAVCAAIREATGAEVETLSWGEVRAAEELPFDAWLTLDPMPAVLDRARMEAGERALTGTVEEVASGGLSLLTREGALDCAADWACLADASEDRDIGLPAISSSAGMVVGGAAFLALAPDADERGLRALDEVEPQLSDLTTSKPGRLQEQNATFVTQVGAFAGIVTTSELAQRRVDTRSAEGLLALPFDSVRIGVVLAGLGPDGDEAVRALAGAVTDQTVAEALVEAGWAGEPEASEALPEPDLIFALQERLG